MGTTAVILGGGYAGLMAANRLAGAGRPGLEVLLVTAEERFVERIRLHEYAAGTREDPTVAYASLLNPAVRLIQGTATGIDAGTQTVRLAPGTELAYDYLVYAVGSGAYAVPDGTVAVDRLSGAAAARRELQALDPGSRVAIVGGGITAVETAGEVAHRYPRLLVSLHAAAPVVPGISAPARRRVERSLQRAGVELHTGVRVPRSGDPRTVLGADVVLWCAGFGVPGLAAGSGLPVDDTGRLLVAADLRAAGEDRIYGAGDAAAIAGGTHARMSCAAAMPMGADAATNILHRLAGEPPKQHDSGFVAQCISVGRTDGAVQFVTAGDTPTRAHIHGRTAAVLKEIICRMTLRWIRSEAKRSGAYTWPKGPQAAPALPAATPSGT